MIMPNRLLINRLCLLCAMIALCISCDSPSANVSKEVWVLKDVHLISMESDQVVPGQTIVIVDDLIHDVGPSDMIDIPEDATIIDGKGKFLIPGFCDMHMHIDHPDVLSVFLSYGVTTVMNYRGLEEHLVLREKAAQNQIFSPNIYTTGDYMEGYPATMPGFLSFDNPNDARQSVISQKEKGYDFIKVYRNLDSTLHNAICDEAAKNNLTVVGHLSPDISLEQSLDAGQKVIAHTEELMYFFNNENDTSKIDDLVDLLNQYEITYTPNLNIFRSLFLQVENLDSINNLEQLKYLQPALFQSWRKEFNYNNPRGEDWAKFMRARFEFLQLVTQKIKEAGIQILASTDAPTSGAFPGISLHDELKELVEIGFTPYEALRTATVEPGIFIQKNVRGARQFGMIKNGYRADFLLLDENPLEKIENTRTIAGVSRNGLFYSKDSLVQRLNRLESVYQEVDSFVRSIENAIFEENIQTATEQYAQAKAKFPDQTFLGYYTMWYAGYRFLYQNRKLTENEKKADSAVKFYQIYLNEYPDLHGSHYVLGMAYKAKKDTLKSINSFENSLKLHSFNPYAKRQLESLQGPDSE